MEQAERKRYDEIDFLKGIACVLMLVGHAIRIKMPLPGTPEKIILYLADYSGPIFFFVSGMNVMTFLERNRNRPGFSSTEFYLTSALLLFFLSVPYNINRANFFTLEIFQCVAVCTAVVYLLMRTRLPAWAHWVLIALLYLMYFQFRFRLELNMISPRFQELRDAIPANVGVHDAALKEMGRELWHDLKPLNRIVYLHFGPLPWIVYFYIGALCYRSVSSLRNNTEFWFYFFMILFTVGPFAGKRIFAPDKSFLDSIFLANFLELDLRGVPSYILTTLGGSGLLYLLFKKHYKGANSLKWSIPRFFASRMETIGKESLMFMVSHWWVLSTILLLQELITRKKTDSLPNPYEVSVRTGLSIVVIIFLVPWLAKVRDRWSRTYRFEWQIGSIMAVAALLAVFLLIRHQAPWANYVSFGASLGFAFLYPFERGRLRKRFTKPVESGRQPD